MTECAKHIDKEFYIAIPGSKYKVQINLHIGPWFDFEGMMEEAFVYIHHGGQNSCMTALMAGTPQMICSGEMFERKFNAESMSNVGAGILLKQREFTTKRIIECVSEIEKNHTYRENARRMGVELRRLGGAEQIVKYLER
jgi:UDP:flavonoid glycosyltransferase YjiC (YdhE family)